MLNLPLSFLILGTKLLLINTIFNLKTVKIFLLGTEVAKEQKRKYKTNGDINSVSNIVDNQLSNTSCTVPNTLNTFIFSLTSLMNTRTAKSSG